MGCCWRLQGVKVKVWCYESATVTVQCLDGVLLAPARRKGESVVLGEQQSDDVVASWGAAGACIAYNRECGAMRAPLRGCSPKMGCC